MNALAQSDPSDPMDMHAIIRRLVDNSDFLEVHALFARNLIVGFARVEGVVVGIIANNSMEKAGALDIDSSDKGARFIRFCNNFNIPVVTLVDVPGFLPGIDQERGGIIRHGAKMLFAYSSGTTPKITIVTRKSYGGSYLAMCSQELGADFVYAWPTAEIAVMAPKVRSTFSTARRSRRRTTPRRSAPSWSRSTGWSSRRPTWRRRAATSPT